MSKNKENKRRKRERKTRRTYQTRDNSIDQKHMWTYIDMHQTKKKGKDNNNNNTWIKTESNDSNIRKEKLQKYNRKKLQEITNT
jgi:hypothetical protein